MTAPAHEWPTKTTGPSAFRIARLVAATSLSSESSGFWTAMTLSPAFSRYGMTFCQHDPSANAPWTRTAVLAFSSAAEAGRPTAIAVRRRLKPTTPLHDFIAPFLHLVRDLETQSPMFVTTVLWAAYLVLRVSIRTLAVGPDEAGFWPVISSPSVTTWMPQFLTLEKVAPRPSSSSSTRKGTTLVSPTSASSPSVKPVTFCPRPAACRRRSLRGAE